MECWLRGLNEQAQPQLLRATRGAEVVGLALWVSHRGTRLGFVPSRCLYLHATGDPQQDEITIEHNGLLTHRSDRTQVEAAMYEHLLRATKGLDQLRLPGLSPSSSLTGLLLDTMVVRETPRPSYIVDLNDVRQRDNDYLAMLSSNTRQQIRRSIKAYEKLGPLTLIEAPDLDAALEYLAALRRLHERRWATKGEAGSFANPGFAGFHEQLIRTGFALGHIQLLRVCAGPHDIGYLYGFVHRARVLFYQSGFDYDLIQSHSRPGVVSHTLSVQHNAKMGHDTYDFLAGAAQYKLSLASRQECMVWTVVHRKTLAFRLEDALRSAWRRWHAAAAQDSMIDRSQTSPSSAGAQPARDYRRPPLTSRSTSSAELAHGQ